MEEREHGQVRVRLHAIVQAVRHRRERAVEPRVRVANGAGAVHEHRRPRFARDGLERDALARQYPVGGRESGGQYALAHTASLVEGRPHLRHVRGASGDRNSSSGSTRIVAFVSSLIAASHAPSPHQPAYTNAPSPSMISRNLSYVMPPRMLCSSRRARAAASMSSWIVPNNVVSSAARWSNATGCLARVSRRTTTACDLSRSRGPSSMRNGTPRSSHS